MNAGHFIAIGAATLLTLAATGSPQTSPAAPSQDGQSPPAKVALTGGRIITVSGDEIDGGTILIEHGRIVAVGTDIDLPYDAMEVDVRGKVVMPGMIDPNSSQGLDRANENIAVAPFLNVYDAIDPSRLFFEDSLRDGVTSVHVMQGDQAVITGVSRVVRPIGLSINEMTVQPDLALKLITSPRRGADRMQQLAELREAFASLDDALNRLAEQKYEEKLKEEDRTIDVAPDEAQRRGRELITDEDLDDAQRALVRLLRGDLKAWWHADQPTDVRPARTLAEDLGLVETSVLILGPESYRAIDDLKNAGRPVVLDPSLTHRQRDPLTGRVDEIFVPQRIHEAGLKFALQPNPNGSMAERYLNYQAALCVRNGIPRDVAIKAITLYPAEMLGLGDSLGSIEPGKVANLVVLSGDPLDFSSWVEHVYIDGIHAYDRSRDHRLQELLRLDTAEASDEDDDESDADADAEGDADAPEQAPPQENGDASNEGSGS